MDQTIGLKPQAVKNNSNQGKICGLQLARIPTKFVTQVVIPKSNYNTKWNVSKIKQI